MAGVSPATFNPTHPIKRGQDWSFEATFKDPGGNPLNLTGWTVAAQAWSGEVQSDGTIQRTTKLADFVVTFPSGVTAGVVKFALTKTQTPVLLDETYYDVALTDTSTIKEFYLEGILPVEEGYTR